MSCAWVSFLMLLVVDKNFTSMQKMQLWFLPHGFILLWGMGGKIFCAAPRASIEVLENLALISKSNIQ